MAKRRPTFLIRSGPYKVDSYSQYGNGQVFLVVFPAFSNYGETWPDTRAAGGGGGPGIFGSMSLATQLAEFLNRPYPEDIVEQWKGRKVKAKAYREPSFRHKCRKGEVLDMAGVAELLCNRCDYQFRHHIFGACPNRAPEKEVPR